MKLLGCCLYRTIKFFHFLAILSAIIDNTISGAIPQRIEFLSFCSTNNDIITIKPIVIQHHFQCCFCLKSPKILYWLSLLNIASEIIIVMPTLAIKEILGIISM